MSEPESEYETDSDVTASTEEAVFQGGDGQMEAMDKWRTAAHELMPPPGRAALVEGEYQADHHGDKPIQPRTDFEERQQVHVVMVSSLDRDQRVYPLPTQLRVKLPRIYRDVVRIDIVQIKFFCGLYAIAAARKNNTLTFSVGGTAYTITVPDGTYSLTALMNQVATLMTAAAGSPYTVTYTQSTGRITITGTGPYTLLFYTALPPYLKRPRPVPYSEWGLGWVLGWNAPVDISGTAITADAFPRIQDDYIFLQLNDTEHMNEVDHTDVENAGANQDSTGQVSHYFGKLLLNSFGCWAQTFIESPKLFQPVLGRLDRLSFTWVDRQGNPLLEGVNAASCDWHMTLRIIELVDAPTAASTVGLPLENADLR
jgi:hypothetical protein